MTSCTGSISNNKKGLESIQPHNKIHITATHRERQSQQLETRTFFHSVLKLGKRIDV